MCCGYPVRHGSACTHIALDICTAVLIAGDSFTNTHGAVVLHSSDTGIAFLLWHLMPSEFCNAHVCCVLQWILRAASAAMTMADSKLLLLLSVLC